jgi:hypothetical protein
MKFVSRAQWGALSPREVWAPVAATQGVKIHYEGTEVPADLAPDDQHHRCADHVRAIQASHLANKAEGYIDLAYSAMVCPHGYVYEGRGPHHRTGANGGSKLNAAHYAVCAVLGNSGLTEPTAAMLDGLVDAVEWLRRDGAAGPEIKGHRDGYATSCPGGPLYAWVQAGAPRPDTAEAPTHPAPQPQPAAEQRPAAPAWPGRYLSLRSPMMHGLDVLGWQKRMSERGWDIDTDAWFGRETDMVVRKFQTEKRLGADGIIGPVTWAAAWTSPVT